MTLAREEQTQSTTLVSYSISCTVSSICSKDQKQNQSHEVAEGFVASDMSAGKGF